MSKVSHLLVCEQKYLEATSCVCVCVMHKGSVWLLSRAPHNQSLHQEIHFILLGADFW